MLLPHTTKRRLMAMATILPTMVPACGVGDLPVVPDYAPSPEVEQAASRCHRRPDDCLARAEAYREADDLPAAAHIYIHECIASSRGNCWRLGYDFLVGEAGQPKDVDFGLYCLDIACEGGSPYACTILGLWWLRRDRGKDWRGWLQRGCDGGVAEACEVLAENPER